MNRRSKLQHKVMRHKRVRAKVYGTAEKPRVSVFKSNRNVFAQFIDDEAGKTVLSSKVVSDKKSKTSAKGGPASGGKINKTEKAMKIGETLAEQAKEAGIKEVVFDRGGFKYHGRIKAVADGLRKGGIKF
ncbi:MAG TPA: 50S ribosomal protein L18 [Candidatus Paceibacterota bacterium]|nr:50S ribosomal protein L18 [Candidatus Paceibacterota bacterium]